MSARTPQDGPGLYNTAPFVPQRQAETQSLLNITISYVDYQSITSMDQHCHLSFEELRLSDYNGVTAPQSPGFIPRPPNSTVIADINVSACSGSSVYLPATAAPTIGNTIVYFDVGKERPQRFAIPKDLIYPRSEFVRLALASDRWKESRDNTIPLPDDSPEVFRLHHLWSYRSRIHSGTHSPTPFQNSPEHGTEYALLVRAYILGEKLLDPHFKDAVLDCIITKLHSTATFANSLAHLVYDHTPETSPLRRLLQDIYIWAGKPAWLDERLLPDGVNGEFALDVCRRYMGFWAGRRPDEVPFTRAEAQGGTCGYHAHLGGVCYKVALP